MKEGEQGAMGEKSHRANCKKEIKQGLFTQNTLKLRTKGAPGGRLVRPA